MPEDVIYLKYEPFDWKNQIEFKKLNYRIENVNNIIIQLEKFLKYFGNNPTSFFDIDTNILELNDEFLTNSQIEEIKTLKPTTTTTTSTSTTNSTTTVTTKPAETKIKSDFIKDSYDLITEYILKYYNSDRKNIEDSIEKIDEAIKKENEEKKLLIQMIF